MITTTPKIIPYKYILFLSMLFVTIDLAAVSMAYKMVALNFLVAINSGATFIFPMTYSLGDVITEVYGYNMARKLIWLSLCLQFIFAILVTIVIHLPSPSFWQGEYTYMAVFGSILRFIAAGTVANIVSNFMNIYIVSKLKIPFEGKLFWVRSILSTIVSGFLLTAIIIVLGFSGEEMNFAKSWIMFKSTYFLEIVYAFALVIPAALTATFLKRAENIDVYDYHTNFNPFKFQSIISNNKSPLKADA